MLNRIKNTTADLVISVMIGTGIVVISLVIGVGTAYSIITSSTNKPKK